MLDANENSRGYSSLQPAMSADRLMKAADVLLAARANGKESHAFVDAWLGTGGASDEYERNGLFTYEELVEGMCFLMRCGLVDPSAPAVVNGRARRHPSH